MPLSKHLANDAGIAYRLLRHGVPALQLEIQGKLISAAAGPGGGQAVLEVAQRRQAEMAAVNASTALHLLAQGMGRAQAADVAAARGISRELVGRLVTDIAAQPRDLAVASWALARLAASDPEPLSAIAQAVTAAAAGFDGQSIATVTWSFATLRAPQADALLASLASYAASEVEGYSPRHFVGIAWALATVRVPHDDYFWAVARVTDSVKGKKWVPQDVSNLLWAFVLSQTEAPPPIAALAAHAAALGWQAFQPQELSIAMWAAMKLGSQDWRPAAHAGVQRLLQHAARQLRTAGARDFEPRHCANAAWALARWQRHCRLTGLPQECKPAVCRPALRALANEALTQLGAFSARELSRLLWALGSQSCLHLRSFGPRLTADFQRPGRLAEFDRDELLSAITVLAWMLERAAWEGRPPRSQRRAGGRG